MSERDENVREGYPASGLAPGGESQARNGSSPEERDPLPLDHAAIQADDALIDALGDGTGSAPRGSDAQLAQVLLAWRAEVDGDLDEALVDVDTALAVMARAQQPARRRRPVLVPFAAAAAMAVIAFSGLGLGAKAADPGDRLWSLTKVLYTDHARSVEAAQEVRTQLEEATVALQEGRAGEAQNALARALQGLPAVGEQEGRSDLSARHEALLERLGDRSSAGRVPSGPADASSATTAPEAPDAADDGKEPTTSEDKTSEDDAPPVSSAPETPTPSSPPEPDGGADPESGSGASDGESSGATPKSDAEPPPDSGPMPENEVVPPLQTSNG